jgi:hypothetical protein
MAAQKHVAAVESKISPIVASCLTVLYPLKIERRISIEFNKILYRESTSTVFLEFDVKDQSLNVLTLGPVFNRELSCLVLLVFRR